MITNCFACYTELEVNDPCNGELPPLILCEDCLEKGWEIIEDEVIELETVH